MKSGSQTVGFASPMPANTQRAHYSAKAGDGQASIRKTARKAIGPDKVRCEDRNMQAVRIKNKRTKKWLWIAVCGHWNTPYKNGFRHIRTEGGLRPFTKAERKMTYQDWIDKNDGDYRCLARLHRPNGDTCQTWAQAVVYAKKYGVILTPELKSRAFATVWALSVYMVNVCRNHDYPIWAMALLKMWGCEAKCRLMISAGGQFAIIFGVFRRMARGASRIAGWHTPPTQIWGPASAKAWLRAWKPEAQA